jgi:hypothetical protein
MSCLRRKDRGIASQTIGFAERLLQHFRPVLVSQPNKAFRILAPGLADVIVVVDV